MRAVNSAKRTDIFNGHGEADNLKRPVPPAPLEKPNYLKDPHRTFKKTQVNPTFNGFVEDAEMVCHLLMLRIANDTECDSKVTKHERLRVIL